MVPGHKQTFPTNSPGFTAIIIMNLYVWLLGSHLFPAGLNNGPADKVNISEAHLKSLLSGISKSMETKMATDLATFEAKFKRDLDDHISVVCINVMLLRVGQPFCFVVDREWHQTVEFR
jgi:hypothetical protein